MDNFSYWSGEDWQEYVMHLLRRRYRPGAFQEIPDKDRGDCGLEGFSDDGNAYQCYAAQEPLSVLQRAEAQKLKITRDIKKFKDNELKLKTLFGPLQIKRWVLLVPTFDSKEVLAHAEKKAHEIRLHKLSHVDNDFAVKILTDATFSVEKKLIHDCGLSKIHINGKSPDNVEILEWEEENSPLVQVIETKLEKLGLDQERTQKLRTRYIQHYIEGQNVLEKLHSSYEEVHNSILRCKAEKENFLETECLISGSKPSELLRETLYSYESEILKKIPSLGDNTAKILSFEAISDWLIRCPLEL